MTGSGDGLCGCGHWVSDTCHFRLEFACFGAAKVVVFKRVVLAGAWVGTGIGHSDAKL